MKKNLLFVFVCSSLFSFAQTQSSPTVCKPDTVMKVYLFSPGRSPQYSGDDSRLQDYVKTKMVFDKKIQQDALGKSVMASFDVDSSGKICNVKLFNYHEIDLRIQQAVVEMICGMPGWIPGGTNATETEPAYNVSIRRYVNIHFNTYDAPDRYAPYMTVLPLPRGRIIKSDPAPETAMSFAEVMPEFPGGMNDFIRKNIKYPVMEKEAGQQGTVYISFIVEEDGRITNIDLVKDIPGAPGLATEAMRVFSMMPNWKPGMTSGKPVRVKMIQPVRFVLQ